MSTRIEVKIGDRVKYFDEEADALGDEVYVVTKVGKVRIDAVGVVNGDRAWFEFGHVCEINGVGISQ